VRDERQEDRYDLWLGRFVRTSASIIGLAGVVFEALKGKSLEWGLLFTGMAGIGFGRAVERFLEWVTTLRPPGREDDQ
jgi:hypothetical protein